MLPELWLLVLSLLLRPALTIYRLTLYYRLAFYVVRSTGTASELRHLRHIADGGSKPKNGR